jgi:hypothetical protein
MNEKNHSRPVMTFLLVTQANRIATGRIIRPRLVSVS